MAAAESLLNPLNYQLLQQAGINAFPFAGVVAQGDGLGTILIVNASNLGRNYRL